MVLDKPEQSFSKKDKISCRICYKRVNCEKCPHQKNCDLERGDECICDDCYEPPHFPDLSEFLEREKV